jgi:two-component system cell cycle sensor histidine kinase/response regulator CckA
MEKQLRQAQKFEAIGQLAGGIAHDFNNMIGAILGWAEIGLEETGVETRLHWHFDKVRHQAVRAAAWTRQLLAFARRQILEPRNLDLNQNITETLSLLEKAIGSNIEIKTKLSENLTLVRADPTQIDQVLMNLDINARDAMPEGACLTIETGDSVFDEKFCAVNTFARLGHYTSLAVTDTGTGMDAATLDRIFEPFFTTKDTGKGIGLGLATVYGIVSQHGGFLQVYSEVGIGTTFRVYLPLTPSAERTPANVEDLRPARGGAETILIAEDHEGLRELTRETLANLGYGILLASDGEEAVRVFQANRDRVDLLLLDVVLPKINGPEAYARIRAETEDVPVIFATGYSPEMALLHNAQERGLTILQKPYVPRDLARRVRETLDRQPAEVHPA